MSRIKFTMRAPYLSCWSMGWRQELYRGSWSSGFIHHEMKWDDLQVARKSTLLTRKIPRMMCSWSSKWWSSMSTVDEMIATAPVRPPAIYKPWVGVQAWNLQEENRATLPENHPLFSLLITKDILLFNIHVLIYYLLYYYILVTIKYRDQVLLSRMFDCK